MNKSVLCCCFLFFASLISLTSLASTNLSSFTGIELISNKSQTVTAEKSKGLVVVFVSAKCPCSDSHIAELKSLAKDFPQFNYVAVHSNMDETAEVAKTYFKTVALPFPVIHDSKAEIADRFQALKTPHAFVVLANGKMAYQGGVSSSHRFEKADKKFLREALDDLAHDRKVKTPEGRTLGCSIYRGEKNVW